MWGGEIPDPFAWAEYGPPPEQPERDTAETAAASAAKARAVADQLRAEAFN